MALGPLQQGYGAQKRSFVGLNSLTEVFGPLWLVPVIAPQARFPDRLTSSGPPTENCGAPSSRTSAIRTCSVRAVG